MQWVRGGWLAWVATVLSMSLPQETLAYGPIATRAVCGPKDRVESGLQGQTTLAERFASGTSQAFNCNLELVGQYVGEGAGVGFAITERCAYVPQWLIPLPFTSTLKNPGLMVIDAKDPATAKVAKYLRTPAMIHPNESPMIHHGRNLLVSQHFDETNIYGKTTDIYDISDCLNLKLKFSGIIPGFIFHTGDFSPDGTILWGSTGPNLRAKFPDVGDSITALDLTDPTKPKVLAQWRTDDPKLVRFHGLSVSDDGKSAYFTIGEHTYSLVNGKVKPAPYQGIGILDVSEVQERKPNPQIRMIGQPLFWDDVVHNQYLQPVTIKGRKYLYDNRIDGVITSDAKVHTGFSYHHPRVSPEETCKYGKPGWGYITFIDIENPRQPTIAGSLKLEVHEPKNCLATAHDPVFGHGYSPLYCEPDNYQDAKKMVCGFAEGGVRV
ncbi:hypothetical protein, partial [Steroidobacter sp.]|uniref:hypothetical protein n=1 Tax=Steroidobacter sp. TaxID=1978227 RepID=UPI001A39C69D